MSRNENNAVWYEHLKTEHGIAMRNYLLEFYGEMKALEALAGAEKYDPKSTNERAEKIIHDTLNKLEGQQYAFEETVSGASSDDSVQPF